MPRSTLAFAFPALIIVAACARASDNPPVVTAPTTTAATASSQAVVTAPAPEAGSPVDGGPVSATATGPTGPDDGGAAAFQACQADADCVAVPRVGCCHNGWKEAVNVAQKDAYAASFTCQTRPLCPMYIIRDIRVPRCDLHTHLCGMIQAQP
jgi:hypothetical protein